MEKESEKLFEIDLLSFLYIILKRRKIFLYFTGGVFIITLTLLLLINRYYEANAMVMPSKQKNQLNAGSFLKNALPLGGLGFGKTSDELMTYTTILTSRASYERIVHRFDLMNVYKQKSLDKTIKELSGNIEFNVNSDETALVITAFDTDSVRAKAMASFAVEILNDIYIKLNSVEAKSNREFIQKRYRQSLNDLKWAEDSLRNYQERYGVFTTTEQIKSSLVAAAELQSQMVLKELQLGILQKTMADDNPEINNLKIQIKEYQKQLSNFQNDKTGEGSSNVFIPLSKIPQRGMEYLRLLREIEIQTKILETLLPLFEQAKIEENRDTPTVVVLDNAYVSDRPVKPKRMIILFVVTFGSILMSIFIIFGVEFYERINSGDSAKNEKFNYIISALHPKRFFKY